MDSVIVSDFGVSLGQTSERLVVRGPRPKLELIEGGSQLSLPFDLPRARPALRLVTSSGIREPARPLRAPRRGSTKPEEIELPLFRIQEIVVALRGVSLSTDLIQACCERGIRICLVEPNGRPVAMLSSPMLTATVKSRREQLAAYHDQRGLDFARAVVRGKLRNQANLLKYFGKYQKRQDEAVFDSLQVAVRSLHRLRHQAAAVEGTCIETERGTLMGLEGAAGRAYWAGVRALLGAERFGAREHRGSAHPINAALNYGYGILYTQVWGALMNAGLEPFGGFLHVDRPGKPSLVLDVMEEFRQPLVDRAVIALVTKGTSLDMSAGLLSDETRRAVAAAVLERLETPARFRGEQRKLKSVIQAQARRLAVALRGESRYRTFAFQW
jgi:CRISPR-associated protein Cas1